MNEFEDDLRERLARRANSVQMRGDLSDLDARIRRSHNRRDAMHNAIALGASTALIVAVVLVAYATTRGRNQQVSSAQVNPTTQTLGPSEAARRAIANAFTIAFEPAATDSARLGVINRSDDLQPLVDLIQRLDTAERRDTVQVAVDAVRFTSTSRAEVDYTITSTHPDYPGQLVKHGDAVYVDHEWKITRISFCQVIFDLGVACPEHEPEGYVPPTQLRLPTTTSTTISD